MKKILITAAAAAAIYAAPAVAEDQALVCWYNDDGAFASASGAPAAAKMGAVERTGDSGGTAIPMSFRRGTAGPAPIKCRSAQRLRKQSPSCAWTNRIAP